MKHADTLYEQAAEHFLALQDPDVSPERIDAAFAWTAAAPEHAAAYEHVQKAWHGDRAQAAATTAEPIVAAAPRTSPRPRLFRGAPRRLRQAAFACAALIAAVAVMLWREPLWRAPSTVVSYSTGIGEIRSVALPDGSSVELGGASRVEVDYQAQSRQLHLAAGEALFKVAKNPQRPFIVSSAGGATRATGTCFNVHRGADGVTVAVLEGSVQVTLPGAAAVGLTPGTALTYTGAAIGAPHPVDIDGLAGWRSGHFTFIDQPLDVVVADLNRYSPQPIVLQGEALKSVRVTGSVAAGGIREWVQALGAMAPVDVQVSGQNITLRPR